VHTLHTVPLREASELSSFIFLTGQLVAKNCMSSAGVFYFEPPCRN